MKNTHFTKKGPGRKHPQYSKKAYKAYKETKFQEKMEN